MSAPRRLGWGQALSLAAPVAIDAAGAAAAATASTNGVAAPPAAPAPTAAAAAPSATTVSMAPPAAPAAARTLPPAAARTLPTAAPARPAAPAPATDDTMLKSLSARLGVAAASSASVEASIVAQAEAAAKDAALRMPRKTANPQAVRGVLVQTNADIEQLKKNAPQADDDVPGHQLYTLRMNKLRMMRQMLLQLLGEDDHRVEGMDMSGQGSLVTTGVITPFERQQMERDKNATINSVTHVQRASQVKSIAEAARAMQGLASAGTSPQKAEVGSDLCPFCRRSLDEFKEASDADRHIQQCLSRHHGSNQQDRSVRKRGARVSQPPRKRRAVDASYIMKNPTDDWLDSVYQERVDLCQQDNEDDDEVQMEGGLRILGSVYDRLLQYQQTGVRWMWTLHQQRVGGIVGDEMGLGKTVQVSAFLGALHHSSLLQGPVLVVAPATMLTHWARELHQWAPMLRVFILHDTGSAGTVSKSAVIRAVRDKGHVLITTYAGLRAEIDALVRLRWSYVVLDEGHHIRNPEAAITTACKRLPTRHRLILTGAPIQNNLKELWSLFDFIIPQRLGTLKVFDLQFAQPIAKGGWASATPLQAETAYRCALVLRDLITPYLLRRLKKDVNADLPDKTEQVLFCRLAPEQREAYATFLASSEVLDVLTGSGNPLRAVGLLRKICNHPDLLQAHIPRAKPIADYGNWRRSGKLLVVHEVLTMWKEQGHRVLLFTQTRQMLDIVQKMVQEQDWAFSRLDGNTSIRNRQALVDKFNGSDEVFVFLLTTRVGGIGVNLTGADRVLLFDPDWNPSTDMQARERAWRLGQSKEVTIYRLVSSGTIEEKIYHRQVFKQVLSNRVLTDANQARLFSSSQLRELFTLSDDTPETVDMFKAGQVSATGAVGDGVGATGSVTEVHDAAGAEDGIDPPMDDNTSILRALFDGKDVRGALSHDAVEALGKASSSVRFMIQMQADNIAQRAAEAVGGHRRGGGAAAVAAAGGRPASPAAPAPRTHQAGGAAAAAAPRMHQAAGAAAAAAIRAAVFGQVHNIGNSRQFVQLFAADRCPVAVLSTSFRGLLTHHIHKPHFKTLTGAGAHHVRSQPNAAARLRVQLQQRRKIRYHQDTAVAAAQAGLSNRPSYDTATKLPPSSSLLERLEARALPRQAAVAPQRSVAERFNLFQHRR